MRFVRENAYCAVDQPVVPGCRAQACCSPSRSAVWQNGLRCSAIRVRSRFAWIVQTSEASPQTAQWRVACIALLPTSGRLPEFPWSPRRTTQNRRRGSRVLDERAIPLVPRHAAVPTGKARILLLCNDSPGSQAHRASDYSSGRCDSIGWCSIAQTCLKCVVLGPMKRS